MSKKKLKKKIKNLEYQILELNKTVNNIIDLCETVVPDNNLTGKVKLSTLKK